MAAGTCAAYGGIHAIEGNPTGCMGLPDYMGHDWQSYAGIPIVCIPGCPVQPDNMTQTLLELLYSAAGYSPMIAFDGGATIRETGWCYAGEASVTVSRDGHDYADGVRIPIGIMSIAAVAQNYTFTMPPGLYI